MCDVIPVMEKNPSLISKSSSASLLAREASIGLDGEASPISKVNSISSNQSQSADSLQEESQGFKSVTAEKGDDTEEPMDAEDSPVVTGSSSSEEVASGSGCMDVSAGPAPYMGPAPIEIIISFDTTGSMSYYLDEVKNKIQDIIQRLFMDIPNMKIGVMAHGDYCDEKVFYLMQKVDFTNDVGSLCQFVKDVEGTGGGDFEECYEWVLSQVRGLSWTPGTQRSLIMIGDAIPHEADYELNKEKLDWRAEADALYNEQGVRVYAVQCQNEKGAADFWKDLANRTHGRHLKLDQFSTIVDILMAICYREHGAEYFEVRIIINTKMSYKI